MAAAALTDLPADALSHVLYRLPTVFQIGGAASVNCAFRDASWLPGDQCAPRFATKLGGHLCETSSHQCTAYGE